MTRWLAFAVAALGSACGGSPDAPGTPPGCGLEVAFAPELAEPGRRAIARVNAASGCWVSEAPGGVAVRQVPVATMQDGAPVCGATEIQLRASDLTWLRTVEIRISSEVDGCASAEGTVLHEVMHAMIGRPDVHSQSGVFSAAAGTGDSLDESSLASLCSAVHCPAFVPEH